MLRAAKSREPCHNLRSARDLPGESSRANLRFYARRAYVLNMKNEQNTRLKYAQITIQLPTAHIDPVIVPLQPFGFHIPLKNVLSQRILNGLVMH